MVGFGSFLAKTYVSVLIWSINVNQCQSEFFSVAKIAELLQSPHGRNILAESQYDIRE